MSSSTPSVERSSNGFVVAIHERNSAPSPQRLVAEEVEQRGRDPAFGLDEAERGRRLADLGGVWSTRADRRAARRSVGRGELIEIGRGRCRARRCRRACRGPTPAGPTPRCSTRRRESPPRAVTRWPSPSDARRRHARSAPSRTRSAVRWFARARRCRRIAPGSGRLGRSGRRRIRPRSSRRQPPRSSPSARRRGRNGSRSAVRRHATRGRRRRRSVACSGG